MYAGRLDSQMDEALGKAEIDLQLEERKRRLGLSETASLESEDEASEEQSAGS
jgi:hypothetical protein